MGDKIQNSERFSAYVVIPSNVFFDSRITPRAKLLYGLISCMSNHKGFCWAKNSTLSKYLSTTSDKAVSDSTVRRLLKELKDQGHIQVDLGEDNGATERKIFVSAVVAALYDTPLKNERPPAQKQAGTPLKNEHQNNININNIPPIAPQEGGEAEPQQKQRRARRKAGQPVSLSDALEESFSRFWEVYPVKKDKQKARERWAQLNPDERLAQMLIDSVHQLSASDPDWQKGAIPHPSTFLYNRRWEDVENLGLQPAAPDANTTPKGVKIL